MDALKKITTYTPLTLEELEESDPNQEEAEQRIIHLRESAEKQAEHVDMLVNMYSFTVSSNGTPYSEAVCANIERQLYHVLPGLEEEKITKLFKKHKFFHKTLPIINKIVVSRINPNRRVRKEIKDSFCTAAIMPSYFALGLMMTFRASDLLLEDESQSSSIKYYWQLGQVFTGICLMAIPIIRATTYCCVPNEKQ